MLKTNHQKQGIDMSGGGFHVHGPHDHELEHAAQGAHGGHDDKAKNGMIAQIAVVTAIVATVGALFAYMGGATQANAGLYKNNAAIKKTEASNQWNFFQAKSTKQSLAELARDLAPDDKKAAYATKIDRYEKEKGDIKLVAEKLELESTTWDKSSDEQMHQHHRWAQATTILQITIALAAIALLTRKRWVEIAMFAAAAGGLLVGGLAMLHI
jgi:hypothetical protein